MRLQVLLAVTNEQIAPADANTSAGLKVEATKSFVQMAALRNESAVNQESEKVDFVSGYDVPGAHLIMQQSRWSPWAISSVHSTRVTTAVLRVKLVWLLKSLRNRKVGKND